MTIKICIIGEGPEDYGTIQGNETPDLDCETKYKGDIQLFIERILEYLGCHNIEFNIFPKGIRDIKWNMSRRKVTPSLAQRVQRGIDIAITNGYHGVTIIIDDRRESNSRIIDELKRGRDDAYKEKKYLPTALGTAIKEIEAWLLADHEALKAGLGKKTRCVQEPEDIYEPKNEYAQRCGESNEAMQDKRKCREKIIANIDIKRLSELCPKGFKPFLDEVKEYIKPLFETRQD